MRDEKMGRWETHGTKKSSWVDSLVVEETRLIGRDYRADLGVHDREHEMCTNCDLVRTIWAHIVCNKRGRWKGKSTLGFEQGSSMGQAMTRR